MKTNKQKLAEALKGSVKRSLQIDDTLHQIIGTNQAEVDSIVAKTIKTALGKGRTVIENGKHSWIEENALFDKTKSGSEVYTWNNDGNKVKVQRWLIVRESGQSQVSRTHLGFAWRNP